MESLPLPSLPDQQIDAGSHGNAHRAGVRSWTVQRNRKILCPFALHCSLNLRDLFVRRSAVPEYHRDSLEKLPFHAAVAHNNAMYMAHSMLTLATSHLIKLVQKNAVPLTDLIGKFRQLAAQIFLDHMKRQRDLLLSNFYSQGSR